jgi:hypothetical protein
MPKKKKGFRELWEDMAVFPKTITTVAPAIAALYFGGSWLSGQVVWASDYRQSQQQINCRLDAFERSSLEGQVIDLKIRVSTLQQKKAITADDARDMALLTTRLDALNKRLGSLGVGCEK